MVEVSRAERRSRALTPSNLPCLSRLATVNLTAGCAHGCVYCYARCYPSYPGDGRIVFYTNTLDRIREEFGRGRCAPPVLYFSPSSDPFQPLPEVLDMAYRVLQFLLNRGQRVAFLTKGRIPERHVALLRANSALVQAQVGITTLDKGIRRLFEPGAASVHKRLAQIESLCAAGVTLRARLDPLIPGWTDRPDGLEKLCRALAQAGVKELVVSALFLRPQIVRSLARCLPEPKTLHALLRHYHVCTGSCSAAGRKGEKSLPAEFRRRLYGTVREIASRHRLGLRICGCENPDITSERCCIAGDWPGSEGAGRQGELFASGGSGRRLPSPGGS